MNVKKLVPWNWFKDEQTHNENALMTMSASRSWLEAFNQLQRDMDRLFDHVFHSFGMTAPLATEAAFGAGQLLFRPNVDIRGGDKNYEIDVELPGVDEKDIKLELVGNRLVIRGEKQLERKTEDENVYQIERSYGRFERVLTLPDDADAEHIEAQFKNGVLTITLPRQIKSEEQGRVIEIKKAS
ncbi:MAG: Hsp20/alpha crystallin family protein [Gammaproteobacteria bacterium]|nr:MAG: Hsp20/alpha crystallin family protein [Gammaproteobacteria bacterium]